MQVLINDIVFNVVWSNKMTKNKFKLFKGNVIKVSSVLVQRQNLNETLIGLSQSPSILIDEKKNLWIKGKLLGCGGFSSVYQCSNDNSVVIKIDKKFSNESIHYSNLGRSVLVPNFLGHGKSSGGKNFILLERFQFDAKKLAGSVFSEAFWNFVAKSVIDCLEFIHGKAFIHCDVKPHNIFLTNDSLPVKAVLGDFGLMTKKNDDKKIGKRLGTLTYMSRDVHEKKYPTPNSDLESLGWSLVEMFGGTLPWKRMNNDQIFSMKTRFCAPEFVTEFLFECGMVNPPSSLKNFLKRIWRGEAPDYLLLKKCFE